MSDMLQLVGAADKQDHCLSVVNLADKLKHVGHSVLRDVDCDIVRAEC